MTLPARFSSDPSWERGHPGRPAETKRPGWPRSQGRSALDVAERRLAEPPAGGVDHQPEPPGARRRVHRLEGRLVVQEDGDVRAAGDDLQADRLAGGAPSTAALLGSGGPAPRRAGRARRRRRPCPDPAARPGCRSPSAGSRRPGPGTPASPGRSSCSPIAEKPTSSTDSGNSTTLAPVSVRPATRPCSSSIQRPDGSPTTRQVTGRRVEPAAAGAAVAGRAVEPGSAPPSAAARRRRGRGAGCRRRTAARTTRRRPRRWQPGAGVPPTAATSGVGTTTVAADAGRLPASPRSPSARCRPPGRAGLRRLRRARAGCRRARRGGAAGAGVPALPGRRCRRRSPLRAGPRASAAEQPAASWPAPASVRRAGPARRSAGRPHRRAAGSPARRARPAPRRSGPP